jgi:retinol dehydrogenase 12
LPERPKLTPDIINLYIDVVFFLASKLLKTIPQAAATTCYVAVHPAITGVSGKYFSDCNEATTSKLASNCQEALRLWNYSDKLTIEKASVSVKSFVPLCTKQITV